MPRTSRDRSSWPCARNQLDNRAAATSTRWVFGFKPGGAISRGRVWNTDGTVAVRRTERTRRIRPLRFGPSMTRMPASTRRLTTNPTKTSSIFPRVRLNGAAVVIQSRVAANSQRSLSFRSVGGGRGTSKSTPVAVITGASSGIGAATSVALGRKGFQIVVGARRVDRLKRVAGEEGVALALDVTDKKSIDAFVREVTKRFGRIDVLVNNAGGALGLAPIEKADDDDWIGMWQGHVMGLVGGAR